METAVVMIVFNRYEKALRVFERVRGIRPKKLYIIADGPREDFEQEKCEKVREIFNRIDWDCTVSKNYSKTNLGCSTRLFTGISSVFENENQAIFLEDDCLPDISFFKYCDELLDRYKEDNRIMLISGTNILTSWDTGASYHFSRLGGIHGWASWKRAWNHMDMSISLWRSSETKRLLLKKLGAKQFYQRAKIYDKLLSSDLNTWDFQFGFARLINNGLAIVPSQNLISNIGFGKDSTHTFKKNSKAASLPTFDMKFPMKHPDVIIEDIEYDNHFNKVLFPNTIFSLLSYIASIFKSKLYV